MIGADTNILVRYLTQDDKYQTKIVNDFIEKLLKHERKLYINSIVICELVWVLEDCYHYKKSQIAEALHQICNVHMIEIEGREFLQQALKDYERYPVDISDCFIGRLNQMSKCPYTASFDKRACRLETFIAVEQY